MVENGNVHPCPGWYNYLCGNVRETPLKDIWENSHKVKYLRGLRKKDIPECLDCPDRGFCAMCMVRNANENQEMSAVGTLGNPLKINKHYCRVAALNRKIVLEWREKMIQQKAVP
jgi:radical SAM protein with 4Fe4S-binding SPASM domain